jgi:hypothetical protein
MFEIGGYRNDTMKCEGKYCMAAVLRDYMPFCNACFRECIKSGGTFKSNQDGKCYRYNGHRWVAVNGIEV